MKLRKFSQREATYWSDVAISCSQVFFGLLAATFFIGKFDINKFFVVLLHLVLSISFWLIGWKLIHD